MGHALGHHKGALWDTSLLLSQQFHALDLYIFWVSSTVEKKHKYLFVKPWDACHSFHALTKNVSWKPRWWRSLFCLEKRQRVIFGVDLGEGLGFPQDRGEEEGSWKSESSKPSHWGPEGLGHWQKRCHSWVPEGQALCVPDRIWTLTGEPWRSLLPLDHELYWERDQISRSLGWEPILGSEQPQDGTHWARFSLLSCTCDRHLWGTMTFFLDEPILWPPNDSQCCASGCLLQTTRVFQARW